MVRPIGEIFRKTLPVLVVGTTGLLAVRAGVGPDLTESVEHTQLYAAFDCPEGAEGQLVGVEEAKFYAKFGRITVGCNDGSTPTNPEVRSRDSELWRDEARNTHRIKVDIEYQDGGGLDMRGDNDPEILIGSYSRNGDAEGQQTFTAMDIRKVTGVTILAPNQS